MKRVAFMTMVAIFAMSFSLMAQQHNQRQRQAPGEMRWSAKERAENLAKQLELTDSQKTEVIALFEKQDAERAAQFKEQKEKVGQDRDARRTEMQALREKAVAENDAALEKIIGKEKMEQWKTVRAERMQKMRETNRQGRRNMPRPR